MLEQRNLKIDLLALVCLALAIFLGLALFTYDQADPPGRWVYPPRTEVANVCGWVGAWTAHLLLSGLGIGAYYLVVSLIGLDAALLTRRILGEPVVRCVGWVLSLVAFTTLASLLLDGYSPGPLIGPGGYLGAMGRAFLESHFKSAGTYILTISVLVGGLLLSTDYVLVRLSAWILGRPITAVAAGARRAAQLPSYRLAPLTEATGKSKKSDVAAAEVAKAAESDDEEEEEEESGDYEIRISGKTVEPAPAAASDEAEEETEEEEVEEEEESDEEEATEVAETTKPTAKPAAETESLRIKNPNKTERQIMLEEIERASRKEETFDYELPSVDLLMESEPFCFDEHEKDVRRKAKILEKTFANFGFKVKVVEIETGPVIAQFEVELEAGLRLSKITSLADDVAIALRVPSVRIVAPIPGKNTVGIEVPNNERQIVRLRDVIDEGNDKAAKMRIPIYLGKDVSGKPMVVDLTSLPHLLIAGRTGTGKSVCLNTIIMSMLMTRRPDDVRMLLIDPKMVELSSYMKLPHLMHPVVTDMKKAEAILGWAVNKMEERYALLARAGVRHISVYNQLGEEELMERLKPESQEEREQIPTHLPYIVIVADEMADLMMTAAKEVEAHIIRLAQKSRAVGIHLILATQKPTVDVITGLIKSNLPARISFQVASRTDSRVVLDEMGADKLLGNGDMLFLWPGTSTLLRGQGAYVGDDEINSVVDFVGTTEQQFVHELVSLQPGGGSGDGKLDKDRHQDDLYDSAVDIVIREGRGSVSLLQRALGIGYGRAARLIDFMAEDGIVGQYNGSQAREVVVTAEQWATMCGEAPPEMEAAKPSRSNVIKPLADADDEPAPAKAKPAAAKPAKLALPAPKMTRPEVVVNVEDEEEEEEEEVDAEEDEYEEDVEGDADDESEDAVEDELDEEAGEEDTEEDLWDEEESDSTEELDADESPKASPPKRRRA